MIFAQSDKSNNGKTIIGHISKEKKPVVPGKYHGSVVRDGERPELSSKSAVGVTYKLEDECDYSVCEIIQGSVRKASCSSTQSRKSSSGSNVAVW